MLKIDLSNKTAVITGASQGIGYSIAEALGDCGASLILLSRNKEKLKANIKNLSKKGIDAKYFILDVSNTKDIESIFSQIEKIDILINNAGIYFSSSILDIDINKWNELININLTGAMNCSKAALKKMIKNNSGRIINISSVSGKFGDPFSSAYSASKFALIGFTQSLANEFSRKNITANCICPGWVETEMAENIFKDSKYAELTGIPLEKLKEYSLESVPIGRYIYPEEVGALAAYLASNFASGITGQAINICGGICTH